MRTLYRKFKDGEFDQNDLPMQGKRKPNGHQIKRGKQSFKRSDRDAEHPNYKAEFGHLEGDTIVGCHHKSAVITLVERLSKCIIAIKPAGRKAIDIETSLNQWFNQLPSHLFKSVIFDCGKEFSNWKNISNQQDVDIYFADPGTPMGFYGEMDCQKKWTSIPCYKTIFLMLRCKEITFQENL